MTTALLQEDAAVKKLTESGHKLKKHEPPEAFKANGASTTRPGRYNA
jgi:hypothetical protein